MESLPIATRAALNGLDRSIPGAASEDHATALEAVGSALFWACALDEQLERANGYKSSRNQHASGRLLPALRLGRNAIAHGAAVIVMPALGLTWPIEFPIIWQAATWARFDQVREGLDREPREGSRLLWEQEIEGENVAATLTATHDWLSDAARRFG